MLLYALTVAVAVFIAELGDKTQLLVMGFAAKEKLVDIIIGVSLATVLLNGMGVYLGAALAGFVNLDYIRLAAGFFFLIFAFLSLSGTDDCKVRKAKGIASLSIGAMFFMAELGDKTQLSAIAFSAQNPSMKTAVFLGSTAGLLFADGVGLAIGVLFGKRLPKKVFSILAFAIFCTFGFLSIGKSVYALAPARAGAILLAIAAAYAAMLFLSIAPWKKSFSQKSARYRN